MLRMVPLPLQGRNRRMDAPNLADGLTPYRPGAVTPASVCTTGFIVPSGL